MIEYFTLGVIGFIAALTPGPDIFYVIRQGLCKGLRTSLFAVSGILFGNIIYLFLVAIGLGIIGKNPYFLFFVALFGSIYLLKISFSIFNEKVTLETKKCGVENDFLIFKEALLLNLSNPKAMIFFAVVVTPFLSKNIMLSCLSLYTGISLAFLLASIISSKIKLEEKLLNFINKVASIVFIIFAIKLIFIFVETGEKILHLP